VTREVGGERTSGTGHTDRARTSRPPTSPPRSKRRPATEKRISGKHLVSGEGPPGPDEPFTPGNITGLRQKLPTPSETASLKTA